MGGSECWFIDVGKHGVRGHGDVFVSSAVRDCSRSSGTYSVFGASNSNIEARLVSILDVDTSWVIGVDNPVLQHARLHGHDFTVSSHVSDGGEGSQLKRGHGDQSGDFVDRGEWD